MQACQACTALGGATLACLIRGKNCTKYGTEEAAPVSITQKMMQMRVDVTVPSKCDSPEEASSAPEGVDERHA